MRSFDGMPRNGAARAPTVLRVLEGLVPGLQRQVDGALQGFAGMIVRAHLPQVWAFETESGSAALEVDRSGHVAARATASGPVDVQVRTTFARLEAALRTRDPAKVPPGPLDVTPRTEKGRRAFEFLRGRLGL